MDLFGDSQIGRGAFGNVWGATDRLGRRLAVKFFSDTTPSQAEQNALDHARALTRVDHRAVVKVFAVETQIHPDSGKEPLAIVMEYVDGTTLSRLDNSLELPSAIRTATDITVQAIHDAGLVHGDLHDANVLVTEFGAKVIDILYTGTLASVGTRSVL